MKKFIFALLLALTLAVAAYAANSDDIYLRRDVFEAKMDAFMAENRLMNQNLLSEIHRVHDVLAARIDRLDARIDGTNTRIDDLRNGLYLWLVVIGTFIAWPKAKNFIQNIQNKRGAQKQSFTLDDVEKLIDARINSKFHS